MVICVGLFQRTIGILPIYFALVQRAAFGILQVGFCGRQRVAGALQRGRYLATVNSIVLLEFLIPNWNYKLLPVLPQLQRAQTLDSDTLAGTRKDFSHIQLTSGNCIPAEFWLITVCWQG